MPLNAQQTGFSLLEVLISLVILSLGLLTLAQLQLTALKYNQQAEWHSKAIFLANARLEQLHASHSVSTADSQQDWLNQLAKTLPAGTGSTNCQGDPTLCSVHIRWDSATSDMAPQTTEITVTGVL